MKWSAYMPWTDLRGYRLGDLRGDSIAALTIIFMGVPQGVAYAMIAGLPPAMGLYASAMPAIVGSIFRSSRHVVSGPTNALSLLVGAAFAVGMGVDPVTVAITLAVMVGVMQVAAGLLGLGTIVDFISSTVVLGYITGAGILIGVGQLPNLTDTLGARGNIVHRVTEWASGLGDANLVTVGLGLGTTAFIFGLRAIHRRIPGPILAMAAATLVSWGFDLPQYGVKRLLDMSPVPVGLPPLTIPDVSLIPALLPLAVAATVLSLVEASSVARAIASRTGQRLHSGAEFTGQGLSNIAAGFFGGYPVSGSLARSGLNEQAGAKSRLSGIMSGILMFGVLLVLGPVVNETPIAALAGVLFVAAYDLVDRKRIRITLKSRWSDRITFIATVLGTWSLSLDQAIYLGVGLSLIFLLRQARLLTVKEVGIDDEGHLLEVGPDADDPVPERHHPGVRILQLEGRLFFGVEGTLRDQLDDAARDPEVRVLVLRLKRTQGMDVTVARVIEDTAQRLRSQGRYLLLAGVPAATVQILDDLGVLDVVGAEQVFEEKPRWFESLGKAVQRATELAGGGKDEGELAIKAPHIPS